MEVLCSMNKKALYMTVSMLCLCVLAGCNRGSPGGTEDSDYIVRIEYQEDEHIVSLNSDDTFNYTINGESVKSISGDYTIKNVIKLPETTKENDLSSQGVITSGVYEANLNIAAEYINYLINNGYDIIYKAETSKFIELYLDNKSTLKRVIITENYIVESDVSEIPEIVIENYLFK